MKGVVPLEHEALPTDGPPETAPNCEAMISKAKASARERIRTPIALARGGLRKYLSWDKHLCYT